MPLHSWDGCWALLLLPVWYVAAKIGMQKLEAADSVSTFHFVSRFFKRCAVCWFELERVSTVAVPSLLFTHELSILACFSCRKFIKSSNTYKLKWNSTWFCERAQAFFLIAWHSSSTCYSHVRTHTRNGLANDVAVDTRGTHRIIFFVDSPACDVFASYHYDGIYIY